MLLCTWKAITIKTNAQANEWFKMIDELSPTIGAFDTETTGLNIGIDKPFLFQGGYLHPSEPKGYTFLVDLEKQPILARAVITKWNQYATKFKTYFGHNVKYDLHMVHNAGLPYAGNNLSDTMFYIRYAHDAIQEASGGPPLALKDYTTRYIDPSAKDHDRAIQAERGAIAKDLNAKLKLRLAKMKPPEKTQARTYTLAVLDTLFSDALFDLQQDLPEDAKLAYVEWLQQDVPIDIRWQVNGLIDKDMIPYTHVNREHLYKYAHKDIVYTLEVYLKTKEALEIRGNMPAVLLENECILPLLEMEHIGFKADIQYLHASRIQVRDYIRARREILFEMAGQEFTIGQHTVIKSILADKFGLVLASTGADILDLILPDLDNPEAFTFIEILQEMRTLEKWYSAYIIRFINNLKRSDRLYTTINQVGAVSGRVTSDFQQFPKQAIKSYDGKELFHPRKIIQPSGGAYNAIVFLDYSQIELRLQAVYTILVGHPDLNLCRAYMPYQCTHKELGIFDYNIQEHLERWAEEWYRVEDGVLWTPTDLHGATTTAATGLKPGDEGFKQNRSDIGKRVNFASQYGAKRKRFRTMFPRASDAEVDAISEAYYTTFPGAKSYHEYCYRAAHEQAYTTNLCGVRYYGASGHKLINLLIQGSSAFFLKQKICELYKYSKEHNIKSQFQMNIHDELSWERYQSESDIFFEYQKIMQVWEGLPIPIVAEMEVTTTNWAEKKGVHDRNDLYTYLRN